MSVLFGVDLSNYQAGIPLAGVRDEGFAFAFCKVSQGYGYRSPDWPRQRDEALAAGLVLAGYHYIDTTDPDGQAANCAAHIGDPSIPVALDCEQGSGDLGNYRRVLDAFQRAGLRVALSYIPRWYWQQIGSPDLSGLPPLWSSRYPSMDRAPAPVLYRPVETAGGSLSKYWQGYGGNHVAVLQFAASATVQGRAVDADAYYGTRDDLAALLGAAAPPIGEDDMPTAREVADAILDTPIPRLGDHIPENLRGGTTSLRNEIAWLTNSFYNLPWSPPAAGATLVQQIGRLAADGGSTPDELRALRAQLDRIEAALDAPRASAAAAAPGGDWRAELRAAIADLRTVTVQFPDPKGS